MSWKGPAGKLGYLHPCTGKKIIEIFEGESNEERRERLVEYEKTAI